MTRTIVWPLVILLTTSLSAFYYWMTHSNDSISRTQLVDYILNDSISDNPKKSLLFLGSSSIRNWKRLEEDILSEPVIQRGFGFGRLEDLNQYLWLTAIRYQPGAVILYAGINDLITPPQSNPEKVTSNFQTFTRNILTSLPDSCIFFISMTLSPKLKERWLLISETNQMIKQLSQLNDQIEFIDSSLLFRTASGAPNKKLFAADQLHLSKTGYQYWGRLIQNHLDQSYCLTQQTH